MTLNATFNIMWGMASTTRQPVAATTLADEDVYFVLGSTVQHQVKSSASNGGADIFVEHVDGSLAHYTCDDEVVVVWDVSCDSVRPATDAEFDEVRL